MSINATERLADFIRKIEYNQLSKDVIDAAKESFVDFLAVSIAGYRKGQLSQLIIDYLLQIGGREESTILGVEKKVPSVNAALANGVSGHSMDLDDGHRKALGHPGVCVIPAALAIGELTGCSGKALLTSIIIGYEIFVRIGKAVNPSLFSRGFHTTGVCGTLAAASAAAKVFSLDKEKIISTLGIAGTQSCGLLVVTHSGQMMKPLNVGKASQNGVISALLSKAGAIGSSKIVEGKDGFVQAFSDNCDYSLMLDRLGESFEIKNCYKKFYPACRHTHAAIDAALYLKNEFNIVSKDIKEIEVTAYPAALKLTEKKNMPLDEAGARFNLAFAVSLALVRGRVGIDDFSMESISDKKIQNLFYKVKIIGDSSLESIEHNIRGAEVEIVLKDNTCFKKRVLLPKGEPENPSTKEELYNKFYDCVGEFWTNDKKEKILECIEYLENIDNIKTLPGLLTK